MREFPYKTALGWTYDSGDFERCLDRALELLGTRVRSRRFARAQASRRGRPRRRPRSGARRSRGPRRRRRSSGARCSSGVGVALCVERSGGLFEHATVRRSGDGFVVSVGSTPSGQGHHTLFAQIAASRLGRGRLERCAW